MTRKRSRSADGRSVPSFTPVPVRPRHDGWAADKQVDFVEALSQCGCVAEACAAVRMSVRSAYALRTRPEAGSFRFAWDAALDMAVDRLADAMLGRAINGVATPIFYKGEQVGERRRYDERLAMFVLQYRRPERYGKWRERVESERHPDGAALTLGRAINHLDATAFAQENGLPRPRLKTPVPATKEEREEALCRSIQEKIEKVKAETRTGDLGGDVP